jgi:hypothetical protein
MPGGEQTIAGALCSARRADEAHNQFLMWFTRTTENFRAAKNFCDGIQTAAPHVSLRAKRSNRQRVAGDCHARYAPSQ